jgi:hypothetical protein
VLRRIILYCQYVRACGSQTILSLYSSVNACPPARMQRLAREIIQSKEFWIICCFKLRHAVAIASRSSLKLCFIWRTHRPVPNNWKYSLVWRFVPTKCGPRTTDVVKRYSNQPTNLDNNREKVVKGFNRAFSANSRRFQKCLLKFKHSYLSQYCMKRYKTSIKIEDKHRRVYGDLFKCNNSFTF